MEYAELEAAHEALVKEHAELLEAHEKLQAEHAALSAAYETLVADHDSLMQATGAKKKAPVDREATNERGCKPVPAAMGNVCDNCGWEYGKGTEPHAII